MQQCTHCQADLPANAQFCSRCGQPAEESQTLSAHLDDVDLGEEDLETTSKQAVVTVPATPPLPALRTRRMHPQTSISEFPPAMGLASDTAEDDEDCPDPDASRAQQGFSSPILQLPLTPPIEPFDDSPHEQEASAEAEDAAPASTSQVTQTPQESAEEEPDAASRATMPLESEAASPVQEQEETLAPEQTTSDTISTLPTGGLPPAPTPAATESDDIAASPTGALEETPVPGDISTSATDNLAAPSSASVTTQHDNTTGTTEEPKYVSPFPPPTPERRSTPRPASLKARPGRRAGASARVKRAYQTRTVLLSVIVVLIVLGAAAGSFALLRQHGQVGTGAQCSASATSCAGGSQGTVHGHPTHLTFSGSVAGPMTIFAKPRCQISTAGGLRALAVNLSGTINNQFYNFGFLIERYHGAGIYSNATASITILFDAPGQSTVNGWGNSAPADTGSITVDRGEQTGSISYTLSGVGTQANTQVQTSGNWTCGG